MKLIKHDAYARQELWRTSIKRGTRTCDWCGGHAAFNRLYQYHIEPDASNQKNILKGLFCSIHCLRAYHDINF